MGKRSNLPRHDRDYYVTPHEAVVPLLPHLSPGTRFDEPCAGNGALVGHLTRHGHICVEATDIDPQDECIGKEDLFDVPCCAGDYFITNPPWHRPFLHNAIVHLSNRAPTWLLFDADWMHTKQAEPYLERCATIVSVGRVKWFGNTAGKDHAAWYFFTDPIFKVGPTRFYGRRSLPGNDCTKEKE